MDKDTLIDLVTQGLSQRTIASRLGCSQATVRYWLNQYELKTIAVSGRKRTKGPLKKYLDKNCPHHGTTPFILEGRGSYRCVKCRSERTQRDRKKLKKDLVEYCGGRCQRCGYNKSMRALTFDHRNADEKSHEMGQLIARRRRDLAFEEVDKCDLLCANCHAEIEEERYGTMV